MSGVSLHLFFKTKEIMKTKEILEITGAGLIIGLGVLAVKKLLEKTEKEEEKLILGTFKYPKEFSVLSKYSNSPDTIHVDNKLVFYENKIPDLSKLDEKDMNIVKSLVDLDSKADDFIISLNEKVTFKPANIYIWKRCNGDYFVAIEDEKDTKSIYGYLLREEG